jgi:hypothetical protein
MSTIEASGKALGRLRIVLRSLRSGTISPTSSNLVHLRHLIALFLQNQLQPLLFILLHLSQNICASLPPLISCYSLGQCITDALCFAT